MQATQPSGRCHRSWLQLALALVAIVTALSASASATPEEDVYTNDFHVVLHSDSLDDDDQDHGALRVARDTAGLRLVRRHLASKREFHYIHDDVPRQDSQPSPQHAQAIADHPEVAEVTQQRGFQRAKRGLRSKPATTTTTTMTPPALTSTPTSSGGFKKPTDPLFSKEWFIENTGQAGGRPGLDLNVLPAWRAGYTGKGVTTAIMDDGLDYLHPDIAENYNHEASYDFSSNDPYPYPRHTADWFNSHGTRCAGEVAAKRNNAVCGSGVAPGSRVASLRMLDQPYMTDMLEAAAMSHMRDVIDIYSASWGPTDNGKTVDGPRNQSMRALLDGVNKGRNGKGNIFVWASGDGGAIDDCNCDGYAASMWTISINAATNDGHRALYDESCSSTLASTFSNGKAGVSDVGVATVDLYGKCTLHHGGTSASAPEAAGVFALTLEANPDLTWRDMQHLVVLTSKRSHLVDRDGRHEWVLNGAGLEFNHLFGYGVLDAAAMVELAKIWVALPVRYHCIVGEVSQARHFDVRNYVELVIDTAACLDSAGNFVDFIEHVQAFVTLKASRRGDVVMFLTSPSNTTSMILGKRPKDDDGVVGFDAWPFMTTHMWGESPRGRWILRVAVDATDPASHGVLTKWTLAVHGSKLPPYRRILADPTANIKLSVAKRSHELRSQQ